MATITRHAITWTFSGTPTSGAFVTGDPYFVAGTGGSITSITPAPTGTGTSARNGSMINPTSSLLHGWDGRVHDGEPYNAGAGSFPASIKYADARNAGLSLPLTLSANQSLCSSQSLNGGGTLNGGNNPNALSDMSVLTCLASNPGTGLAFRPPYAGSTKPLWLKSQVDYGKLPGLSSPIANPTTGADPILAARTGVTADEATMARLQYDLPYTYQYLTQTTFAPLNNRYWYPSTWARNTCHLILYSLCNFSGSEQTYANRLIQQGIDSYAVLKIDPKVWAGGGAGFNVGRMFPIMFAGYMLGDSDMLNVCLTSTGMIDVVFSTECAAFQEINSPWSSPNAFTGYRLPRPRSSYPNGPPIYGDTNPISPPSPGYGSNHSFKDPAGKYDAMLGGGAYPYPTTDGGNTIMSNAGDYMQVASPTMPAVALAIRILGLEQYLGPKGEAFLDYCDRWANDPGLWFYFGDRFNHEGFMPGYNQGDYNYRTDIYGFGGSGNGFCRQMWDTYRYPGGRKILIR
jgi:hypothetical protein